MDLLRQDLRYAFRTLAKAPGFALVIVTTLALGIGANSAIFNLLDQVLLRDLPAVDSPAELVVFDGPGAFRGRTTGGQTFSYPVYRDLRERTETFSGIVARYSTRVAFNHTGAPETVTAELVSGNYFDVLGIRPAAGRLLQPADEAQPGAHPVVVLSHGFWTRRFGADPSLVGQTVRINDHPMSVAGIVQAGFNSIDVNESPDVFVSVMMKALMTPTWDMLFERQGRWLHVMGRLKPGVTREQAAAQMNVVYRQINEHDILEYQDASEQFKQRFVERTLELLPGRQGRSDLRADLSAPLVLLMAMVGLVLLIACANTANLLLARATTRQREIALRLALGASRRQIVRQLVMESLVLATAGGAFGMLVSLWTSSLLIGLLPFEQVRRSLQAEPDVRVWLFTGVVSALTGLAFGVIPALQATRTGLTLALKDDRTAGGTPSHLRFRKSLVVAQVSLSLVLIVGAGLFARSLQNLRTLDPGFQVEQIYSMSLDPSLVGQSPAQTVATANRLRAEVAAQPGVAAVGLSETAIMTFSASRQTVSVEGYTPGEGEDMNPSVNVVTPGFFDALNMPLLRGRAFTDADTAGSPEVAVINETMARYFFGESDPIGRHFGARRDGPMAIEIVGVVRDGKHAEMREEPLRLFYRPHTQEPELGAMTLYVRMRGEVDASAQLLRDAVARVDPKLPVYDLRTLETVVGEALFLERLVSALSAAFGLLATVLAAVGLYGVMSFSVQKRTREIGVRLALGAEQSRVLSMILREVAIVAGVGIAIGLPASAALSRAVQAQLFNLSPTDPPTFAAATLLIAAVTLLAGLVPARRAARVDPVVALRSE